MPRASRDTSLTIGGSREPARQDRHRYRRRIRAARYGRLDYLFNNAGIGIGGDARDLTAEHWHRVLGVDLFGVVYGTLAAYPIMARQGDRNQALIVFPASIRLLWRAYRIAPGLLARLLNPLVLRRVRELRSYRLAPDEAEGAAGSG
jgi:short chain dehydrogenase